MILKERYVKPISAGEASWNTHSDLRGILEQININPSSSSTTYDIEITDDNNTPVYSKNGLKGIFTDDVHIGVFGIYTFNVDNVSTSLNSFTTTILWSENP